MDTILVPFVFLLGDFDLVMCDVTVALRFVNIM